MRPKNSREIDTDEKSEHDNVFSCPKKVLHHYHVKPSLHYLTNFYINENRIQVQMLKARRRSDTVGTFMTCVAEKVVQSQTVRGRQQDKGYFLLMRKRFKQILGPTFGCMV